MADGLRSQEIANALLENERAIRAAQLSLHRAFTVLDENTKEVFQNTDAIRALERQVAQIRSAVETLVAVQQTFIDLRKGELALEHDKVEREITGEVARVERDRAELDARTQVRTKAIDTFGKLFTTRGGLLLCGGMIGATILVGATWVLGSDEVHALLSGLVALSKGWRD